MVDVTADASHDQLERYLLGTLPEAERERIDERILTDSQLFDDLCVVENELAYDYAIGLLAGDERRLFEERFLQRSAIQARVRTARQLLEGIRAAEDGGARRSSPWLIYAAVAASLILVAWLARENIRLRDDASERNASLPTAASGDPARPAPPPPQTDRTATAAQPIAPPEKATPFIVSVFLQPGVVRSSATPSRVRLPVGSILRLQLGLPAGSTGFASYTAALRTPDDAQVWSGSATRASKNGELAFAIPASAVPSNDYEITLYGVDSRKEPQEIANYAVSVLRR
jgi:hypothetical protein